MTTIVSLQAKNTLLFKDVSFALDRKGLTVIHGRNLNNTAKGDTNRSGKSAFFGLMHEVLFDEPLSGNLKDKRKSGSVTITLEKGENKYAIVYSTSPAGTGKYSVLRNGQNMDFSKKSDAKAFIRKLIGRTPGQFRLMDYLDNRIPSEVRSGNTLQRREFFTEFFNLWVIDAMKKTVKRRIADMKDNEAKIEELTLVYSKAKDKADSLEASYEEDYGDGQAEKAATKIEKLEVRLSKLLSQSDTSQLPVSQRDLVIEVHSISKTPKSLLLIADSAYAHARYRESVSALGVTPKKLGKIAESLISEIADLEPMVSEFNDYCSKERELKSQLKALKSETKQGSCPTCGRAFDKNHTAEQEIERLTVKLAKLTAKAGGYFVDGDPAPALANRKADLEKVTALQKAHVKLPEEPEFTGDVYREQYNKVIRVDGLLGSIDVSLKEFYGYDTDRIEGLFESGGSKAEAKKLSTEIKDLQSFVVEERLRYQSVKDARAELKPLRARLQELESSTVDKASLELIYEGYNSTASQGIRTTMLRNIVNQLEETLNYYASQVFPERYVFKFDLESNSDFQIIANRVDVATGMELVSDVRKLSGAESGIFDLLLSVALRSFLPKSKRLNVMILDEVNANFGPQMNNEFQRLLKVLLTEIEHIIVITPRPEDEYEDATYMTMTRKGNMAKLINGSAA